MAKHLSLMNSKKKVKLEKLWKKEMTALTANPIEYKTAAKAAINFAETIG
jgi:hypothetical protein